ncbi:MAG TPA: AAA family ATPase, partial [Porphyromonadaceae bacterium]|nr:AAA family ATPase [Porphyromonadaceae bacterium]
MYKSRIADKLLSNQLEAAGVVLIQGPKWCGKTTTAKQQAKSVLYVDDPSTREANIILSESDPSLLLQGDTPKLIDEWQ